MAVPPPLTKPPLLPTLTPEQTAANLAVIYSAPAALSKYGCFFFLQEFSSDDFLNAVGYAERFPDTDVLIQKYYQYTGVPSAGSVQLYVHSISVMETGALGIFSGGNQPYQVFVSIDKTMKSPGPAQILLPYQSAKLLSAAFVQGLVTRLVLDNFKTALLASTPSVSLYADLPLIPAAPTPPSSNPPTAMMDVGSWAHSYLSTLSTTLVQPGTWTATSTALGGNLDYLGCLNFLTDSSFQTVGILSGWLAGDAITDPAFGPANTAACKTAIWNLLGSVYAYDEIGTFVGYALTFLNGFISSERTRAAVSANPLPQVVNSPSTGPSAIYTYLVTNANNATDFTPLANALFDLIVAEFYAISGNNLTSAAKYQWFIQGFTKGLLIGADALYGLLFEEGFQLGYTKGFSAGYAQGYSAGWTEAYAVGYQQGQQTWMSGLQNIISGPSGTTGLAGLLTDSGVLGTILNDAVTVGTAIASLF